jgi:hypothetical protein
MNVVQEKCLMLPSHQDRIINQQCHYFPGMTRSQDGPVVAVTRDSVLHLFFHTRVQLRSTTQHHSNYQHAQIIKTTPTSTSYTKIRPVLSNIHRKRN